MHSNRGLHAELCTYCKKTLDDDDPEVEFRFAHIGMAYKFCSNECKEDWKTDLEDTIDD